MSPERKAAILTAVAAWLDSHPDEPLPPGVDPSFCDDDTPAPDLASMVAAVTACRFDVQLQGKAMKRLEEKLEAAFAALTAQVEHVAQSAAHVPASRAHDASEELMDLFHRLRRCVIACDEARNGLPFLSTRAAAKHRIDGIASGLALTLNACGDVLGSHGLRAFDPTGAPFEPSRMRAIGTAAASAKIPAGHVAATMTVGFEQDGVLFRAAQVTVAREHGAAAAHGDTKHSDTP